MYNLLKNDFTTTFKKEVIKGMEIIHVSAECYPVAKAGGLGDVVGALPKYQTAIGPYCQSGNAHVPYQIFLQ